MKPLSELNPATAHLWDMLDNLCEPTPAVAWLLRAGEELRTTRSEGAPNKPPSVI